MKKIFLPFAAVALLLSSCKDAAPKEELVINLQEKGAEVAPSMYGIFFEEINHAGDGGLYAELVKNRSFEELEMPEGYYAEGDVLHPKKVCNHISGEVREGSFRWTTEPVPGWTLSTKDAAEMKLTKEQPKFSTAPNNLKVTIKNASTPVRLINEGYWGMNLVKDNSYQLRTIIRPASDYKGKVTALLLSEQGEVLASAPVDITAAGQWNDLSLAMQPTATSAKGKLALEFDAPGTVYVDYVSLFPEKTFHDRPNGLRKDVAEILEGLHPAFVRWPGGCVVEGISLENRFEWKKSLGDPAARSGEYSTWGYRCSYGFDIFYTAIKAKYPELILISNHGLGGTGKIAKTDMIDPHWYVNPEFFFQNTTIFDNHPRGKYDVYVGEYACNANVGGGNMRAALSEAAFISGMERNGDLVKMTSYAPLLENRNDRSWAVNLIWLDTDQVLGRSSYYVQQMAAENRPTYNVKSNMTMSTPRIADYNEGRFGFGSWHTQVEFKDVKLTGADGAPIDLDLNKAVKKEGEWSLDNGLLKQTSLREPAKYIVDGFNGNQFTLEFKVRKEGGNEGFFLYFGLSEDSNKGFVYNVAGWNNGTTAVEGVIGGRTSGVAGDRVSHSLETDKWYDAKLVVTPQKSELFMDGKLILAHAPETTPLQFFSSGYDEATGEVIVKVVNSEAQSYPLRIKLDGVDSVEKTGKVISLSAASDMDENSFEEPMKISPKESEYKGFGKSFDYTFPPFSYTILRVKAK